MTVYSHSRLSSFENCPRQFQFRYIDKIETEREGIEGFVGKRVHEILERLYHHVARHRRPPSLAQVHERFDKDWRLHWHVDVQIVRHENDVDFYRQLGTRCLENYYRSHYPFDDGETVGIEQKVQLTLDSEGRYRMRGVVDRVVRHAEGRWEIHDYKTGGWLPPRRRIDEDRQLALYQIALEQQRDDVQSVELVWHYLAFDKTLRSSRKPEQLAALREQTIELIDRIQATSTYPAKTGPLCRWCEFRELCPEGQAFAPLSAPGGPEPPPPGQLQTPALLAAAGAAPAALSERDAELSDGPRQLSLL